MEEINQNKEEMPIQEAAEFDYDARPVEYAEPKEMQAEHVVPQEMNPLAENEIITPQDGVE